MESISDYNKKQCHKCQRQLDCLFRQANVHWRKLIPSKMIPIHMVKLPETLDAIFKSLRIQAPLSSVSLRGDCRVCDTNVNKLRLDALTMLLEQLNYNTATPELVLNSKTTTKSKIPVFRGKRSESKDKRKFMEQKEKPYKLDTYKLAWKGRKIEDSNGNMQLTHVQPNGFQKPMNLSVYRGQQQMEYSIPNGTQIPVNQNAWLRSNSMSHSMDHSRLQNALYQRQSSGHQRIPQKITPSGQPSGSLRRGQHRGSGKKRASWQETPQAPQFPTNFARILKDQSPPVPPALLRAPFSSQSAPNRPKDASSKLKIALRVLPCDSEKGDSQSACVHVDSARRHVTVLDSPGSTPSAETSSKRQPLPKVFPFDAAFPSDASLTEICSSTLLEVIQTAVNGSDSCLLAFGHAGPEKSRTLLGSDQSSQTLGVLPTAVCWLYRLINQSKQRKLDSRFSVRVSAVEISGQKEEIRDLLKDFANNSQDASNPDASKGLLIKEDPIFGPQLHNVNELRAPTADKAAMYLDAALAYRKAGSPEERRNSHLFFTLHIYQYKVESGKTGVAGGRSRLHLIDLGSGAKSSKTGYNTLTFPAIGNVLLTLLQGQKYLPFKESKLTQLLKESVGSTSCRAISVLSCVSSETERYYDTNNIIQVTAKLQRIKKRSKPRMGISSKNSSGGESSSCDERRSNRWRRSTSDPEATSSSEQSAAETVIFLGEAFRRNRTTHNQSDREELTTDAESSSQLHPVQSKPPSPRVPIINPSFAWPEKQETWIDGPSAYAKPKPIWIDGPASPTTQPMATQGLDPFKREMIQRWVKVQEEERRQEIWIDGRDSEPEAEPQQSLEEVSPPGLPEPGSSEPSPMNTSSDASAFKAPVETRDLCIQVEETEIDMELALQNQYLWTGAQDAELRFLEDIQEADEEDLSSAAQSIHSGRMSRQSELPSHRNEALAIPKILLGSLDLDCLLSSGEEAGLNSSGDSHPLRVLSREAMEVMFSDSVSEQLERMSLPSSDILNEEEMADEELEQAMAASMSSVRSHDVLEKLRSESKWQQMREEERQKEQKDLFNCNWNLLPPIESYNSGIEMAAQPLPLAARNLYPADGASIVEKSERTGAQKTLHKLKHLKASNLVCCSMASSGSSGKTTGQIALDTSKIEKLQKPTIPPIPALVCKEITSKLSQNQKSTSKVPKPKDSLSRSATVVKNPKQEMEALARSTLPGNKTSTAPDTKLPKQGWRRRDSNASAQSSKSQSPRKAPAKEKKKDKDRGKSEEKSLKSPSKIMSFLKSPTSGKKSASCSPALRRSFRASSGYDSGQDSGVGTGDSPDLALVSPYSKVTQPRKGTRTSSGHGSDSSTSKANRAKLTPMVPGKGRNRDSFSASSGYESAGMKETDTRDRQAKSAPQSPMGIPIPINRMHQSTHEHNQRGIEKLNLSPARRYQQRQVDRVKVRQERLKQELREAKERLCIEPNKWSFDLHASDCLSVGSSALLEALEQETKILEKRVIACRSHVMMVTTLL